MPYNPAWPKAFAKEATKLKAALGDQIECSIRNRIAGDISLPVCRDLDISFVPFSLIRRGFLTSKLTSLKTFGQEKEYNFRNVLTQFQADNFEKNFALIVCVLQSRY